MVTVIVVEFEGQKVRHLETQKVIMLECEGVLKVKS